MRGLYWLLYSSIVKTEGVHLLLRFYIDIAWVYDRLCANYNKMVKSLAEAGEGREHMERTSSRWDSKREAGRAWDWRGFPKALPISKAYHRISTTWMVYAILGTLLQDQLSALAERVSMPLFGLKGNCMLTFRVLSHMKLRESFNVVFPLFHLVWRILNLIAGRHLNLTMLMFMLQTDRDVARFMQLYKSHRLRPEYSRANVYESRRSSTVPKPNLLVQPYDPIGIGTKTGLVPRSTTRGELRRGANSAPNRWRPLEEKVIRHAMCYQVHYGNEVYFKLRPNRTEEARNELKHTFARLTSMILCLFSLLVVVFSVHLSLVNWSDRKYLAYYPGCNQQLEALKASGQLPSYSRSYHLHQILTNIADTISNIIIWCDSGLALLCVPALCYMLNFDLLLYWSGLESRLELLLERARWRRFPERNTTGSNKRERPANSVQIPTGYKLAQLDKQIELELQELYFELNDFISEISRADYLISDALTLSVTIWFVCSSLLGINFLLVNRTQIPVFVEVALALGFGSLATVSHFLLTLHRRCQRTYKCLCSIMASGPAGSAERLLVLMDFFTKSDRTAYTLAQRYPFKSTTFVTIISYSGSCLIIGLTLFGGNQRLGRAPSFLPDHNPAEPTSVFKLFSRISGLE